MYLRRWLPLVILVGLAGLTVAAFVLRKLDNAWRPGAMSKMVRQDQTEIVRLFIGHLARGTTLPLTNPDEFQQPAIRLEGDATALFQIPDEIFNRTMLSDQHVLLRSHSEAMTGQFARKPDWIISFVECHGSGFWIVTLTSRDGPTKSIWEFEFRKTGPLWHATLLSTTIGCG